MPKERKSAEIIALTESHLPTGDTPTSIICLLENLNQKAERGELVGMCVAYIESNGHVFTHICHGSSTWSQIVSAVTALFHDINVKWSKL
jgi:hypothetical protein